MKQIVKVKNTPEMMIMAVANRIGLSDVVKQYGITAIKNKLVEERENDPFTPFEISVQDAIIYFA